MTVTTRMKLKMPVEVELDVEIDPRTREAIILSARIDPSRNFISPRAVWEVMNGGEYHHLDQLAREAYIDAFIDRTKEYRDVPTSEIPEGVEIRSMPLYSQVWATTMKTARGKNMVGIPMNLVCEALEAIAKNEKEFIMIEPVLCRVPTLYVWPMNPSASLETVASIKSSVKAHDISRMEDGSWKMTWKNQR